MKMALGTPDLKLASLGIKGMYPAGVVDEPLRPLATTSSAIWRVAAGAKSMRQP